MIQPIIYNTNGKPGNLYVDINLSGFSTEHTYMVYALFEDGGILVRNKGHIVRVDVSQYTF